MDETVLTTRRATRLVGRQAVPGRLRVTDRAVRFSPAGGGDQEEVALREVRRIAVGRAGPVALLVESPGVSLRLRCFGAKGVARLIARAREADRRG